MNGDIQVKPNESTSICLFDTHDIQINRDGTNDAELVIHPCNIGKLSVRFAKEPYACEITLANGKTKNIHLGDEDDWGNIQQMNDDDEFKDGIVPEDWDKHIGWGNDADGHIEIVKVVMNGGYHDGREIPLKEFIQDVADFIIYYES